ncbi:MAG TPA: SnoaL-like polyketide cyclase, partial [Candidatus Saccharimonadia bacterium]|nr:SnoaL-like polyketide cyclase [Candidatus Saccharimonadia bacterium]
RVITRMVASGRNNGMFGTEPDNAPVQFVAISIMEVKDGKLAHNWVERSAYELHQRLTAKKE